MGKIEVVNSVIECPFILSSIHLDKLLISYASDLQEAMKAVYNSGILSRILEERLCDNEMLGFFIRELSCKYNFSKVLSKKAIVEWVEICAEIYGLDNRIDLGELIEIRDSIYLPSHDFFPYLNTEQIFDFSYALEKCQKNNCTINDIGTVIDILNYYLFCSLNLANTRANENEINDNKQQCLEILNSVVDKIKDNEYLRIRFFLYKAQVQFLLGNFNDAASCYLKLLEMEVIIHPKICDEKDVREYELAAMIAHNLASMYYFAGNYNGAKMVKTFYEKYFEYQKKHYKRDETQPDKLIDDLCNNYSVVYITSTQPWLPGHKSLLEIDYNTIEKNLINANVDVSANITFLEPITVNITEKGELLIRDNQYDDWIYLCFDYNLSNCNQSMKKYADLDGLKFEYYCASLLRKNGFVNVEVTAASRDQGADIIAMKNQIKYAIQCKYYKSPLGNTSIQEINAAKHYYKCHVGVVMTNSSFTSGAKELAEATGTLLWDGDYLNELER